MSIDIEQVAKLANKALGVGGAIGAAIVDYERDIVLAAVGDGRHLDVATAALGSAAVVRAELASVERLGLDDRVEDVLVVLDHQYHLVRPAAAGRGGRSSLCLFVALDRSHASLAIARGELAAIAREVSGCAASEPAERPPVVPA
jgi:hypothetical protein